MEKIPHLLNGDCLEVLKTLEPNSVESMVTDPPAGIAFMGKKWDDNKGGRDEWIKWMSSVMKESLRVMKPGAHGLVWAIPRTSHWTATALEDAGFEVRDVVTHHFGSGFPKSMNVSIAIDKQCGAMGARGRAIVSAGKGDRADLQDNGGNWTEPNEHEGITDAAKQWAGWGTALKPASEHWILIRKPCSEKTVAQNVLKWGCGAINIDASRIAAISEKDLKEIRSERATTSKGQFAALTKDDKLDRSDRSHVTGRFPANLLLSHSEGCVEVNSGLFSQASTGAGHRVGDSGGASRFFKCFEGESRFFYCAKASKSEKNAGCGDLELREANTCTGATRPLQPNTHPTVKPLKLLSYLIKLISPPGGVILDPFMGSGSTGVAAIKEGFKFIGIEQDPEYLIIAQKRIDHALLKDE